MARSSKPSPSRSRTRTSREEARAKKKGCAFCRAKIDEIDYKKYTTLRVFTSDRGKIRARRVTGLCRKHQDAVAVAVKRAREIALLPYVGA